MTELYFEKRSEFIEAIQEPDGMALEGQSRVSIWFNWPIGRDLTLS